MAAVSYIHTHGLNICRTASNEQVFELNIAGTTNYPTSNDRDSESEDTGNHSPSKLNHFKRIKRNLQSTESHP